jgi:hypothetical protein
MGLDLILWSERHRTPSSPETERALLDGMRAGERVPDALLLVSGLEGGSRE